MLFVVIAGVAAAFVLWVFLSALLGDTALLVAALFGAAALCAALWLAFQELKAGQRSIEEKLDALLRDREDRRGEGD